MKNLFKTLICSLLLVSFSCHESDNTIDNVIDFDGAEGAILRTLSIENAVLNASDPSSAFDVLVEEYDAEQGGLFQEVEVYVELRDLTSEATTSPTGSVFVKSIPASEFSPGDNGLPVGNVTMTFAEARDAMGLTLDPINGFNPGDVFVVDLRLVLTDGRSFGSDGAGSTITGGFFSSPFQYNSLISCSSEPGVYTIHMYDNYGDGWQTGDYTQGLSVDIDGAVTMVAMCSQWGDYTFECTPTSDGYFALSSVTIPEGTSSATWSWPGDQYGEIGLIVLAPDGSVAYSSGTVLADGSGPFGDGVLAADGFGQVAFGVLPIAVCAQ